MKESLLPVPGEGPSRSKAGPVEGIGLGSDLIRARGRDGPRTQTTRYYVFQPATSLDM